jgi:hypothetical protein
MRKMLKQKYGNGLWIGRTLFVCPRCISLFHLVPFAFVCACLLGMILAMAGILWPIELLAVLYGFFLFLNTMGCLVKSKNIVDLFLPIVYLLMHFSYGIGTIFGIIARDKET